MRSALVGPRCGQLGGQHPQTWPSSSRSQVLSRAASITGTPDLGQIARECPSASAAIGGGWLLLWLLGPSRADSACPSRGQKAFSVWGRLLQYQARLSNVASSPCAKPSNCLRAVLQGIGPTSEKSFDDVRRDSGVPIVWRGNETPGAQRCQADASLPAASGRDYCEA